MWKILLLYNLVFSTSQGELQMVQEIPGEFHSVHTDNMDQLYVVNKQNHLLKISAQGDTLYTFEDKAFPVNYVDPSNALKILVYNDQQNILGFLDKTLSAINHPIQLDELDIPISKAVASSRDNLFWVFDENIQELKKYDQSLKEISNSGNITALTGKNIQPIFMQEENAKVYLLDSIQGVFQFDHLGTYLFNYKNISAKKIVIKGDKIIFLKNNELYLYDTVLLEEQKISLKGTAVVKDFAISKNSIFILTEQNIRVYQSLL